MAKNEKTSKKVATKASELLSDPKTPKKVKSVAASALSQAEDKPKKELSKRKNKKLPPFSPDKETTTSRAKPASKSTKKK